MKPVIASGYEALERRDCERALRVATACLERDENGIEALELGFRAHEMRNDAAGAADMLARILRAHPRTDWAYVRLVRIFLSFGRLDKAEELLRQGLRYCPAQIDLHVHMGNLLSERNLFVAGEWHFRRALDIDASHLDALTALARNLIEQGRTGDADRLYRRALRIAPDDAGTLAHWSRLAELEGDIAAADERLTRAETAAPGQFTLLRARLEARRGNIGGALQSIGGRPDLNGDALLERGRLLDRLGEFDRAWGDFLAANAAFVRTDAALQYDAAGVDDLFARLRETFTADCIAALPVAERRNDTAQPVFIVGAPRSGTTLIEQVLVSHSSIRAGGELPFIAQLRSLSEQLLDYGEFPGNLAWTGCGDLRHVASLFRDYYLARAAEYGLTGDGAACFTDKMPWNEMYLPLIRMAFPTAPIIYLRRHPLDVLISMLANKLNHGFHCAYRVDDIVHHLLSMDHLYRHYCGQSEQSILEIGYESFVASQERETRRMLEHIGLDLEPACLAFHETSRYAATPSYREVGEPVSTRAVGRHRNYREKLRPQIARLQGLIDALPATAD